MRCVVLAVILSASLCAALPLKFLATGGPCEAAGGKCGNPDACSPAVGGLIYGQCPGTDVCCLPKAAAPGCTKLNGKCDDKSRASTTCAGSWVTGQCPGKYVCCAPSGAAQQQQQPGLAQKPAPGPAVVDTPRPIQTNTGPGPIVSGAKLLCMSFDDGPFISSATDVSKRLATAMYEAGVPATFYVNCHREMADSDRTAWLDQLKKQKHSIGNHMCEHDIMAQSHYTAKYGSYMRQPDGCLTQPGQQAIFRTHLMDNYNLWQKYGVEMKTARLNGDGRFNPCVVKHTENAILPDTKAHKHVTWQYEVGPTMKKDVPTSYVMGHLKTSTGVSLDGFTLNSDPPGNPVSKRPIIVLAHDLHYKDSTKVQLLQNWVKKMSSLGYSWGKINDQGECVPQ